jgi:hypothetical protein
VPPAPVELPPTDRFGDVVVLPLPVPPALHARAVKIKPLCTKALAPEHLLKNLRQYT